MEINRKIKIIYSYSPKLNLEILNSIAYNKGLIIKLDAFEMIENSLRNKRDNFTYFGFIEYNKKKEILFNSIKRKLLLTKIYRKTFSNKI